MLPFRVIVRISSKSGTPETNAEAGACADPLPTLTVHVADEDENTSVSVVIVILSPAESAEVEVKTKFRASGSLEMVVSPFRTDALPHATDVALTQNLS